MHHRYARHRRSSPVPVERRTHQFRLLLQRVVLLSAGLYRRLVEHLSVQVAQRRNRQRSVLVSASGETIEPSDELVPELVERFDHRRTASKGIRRPQFYPVGKGYPGRALDACRGLSSAIERL